jgi:hypothetical protein
MSKDKKPTPPANQKSEAQKWKEFGEFMNARDYKGNPKGQGNLVKKRHDDLLAAIVKYNGGAKNIPGGDVKPTAPPSKYPSVSKSSRPVRDAKPRPKRPTPVLGVAQERPKSPSSSRGFPKGTGTGGGLSLGLMGANPPRGTGKIQDAIKKRSTKPKTSRSDNTRTDIFGHIKKTPAKRGRLIGKVFFD